MTAEKETVAPYIFAGLPESLQYDFIQQSYVGLMRSIYAGIEKAGGINRYRDEVILETSSYGSYQYEAAYVRRYNNLNRLSDKWRQYEDVYLLKHIGSDKREISAKLGRSVKAITSRIFILRGRTPCFYKKRRNKKRK